MLAIFTDSLPLQPETETANTAFCYQTKSPLSTSSLELRLHFRATQCGLGVQPRQCHFKARPRNLPESSGGQLGLLRHVSSREELCWMPPTAPPALLVSGLTNVMWYLTT